MSTVYRPQGEVESETEAAPAGIVQAAGAFRRELNDLLPEHHGKWVAYHLDRRIGIGPSKSQLYRKCLELGFSQGDFIVRRIVPDVSRGVEEEPL
jgi:hypothetical protein